MIVLTNESHPQFDELHSTYIETFQPVNRVEMDLIDQMVASQWRLRRIWFMQTAALDLKMDQQDAEIAKKFTQIDQPTRLTVAFTTLANEEKSLDLLLRYETTYTRLHQRAMSTLLRLRRENEKNEMDETAQEAITSEELRNDPAEPVAFSEELRNDPDAPVAKPLSELDALLESPEFAQEIVKMSPEAIVKYLLDIRSRCDSRKPQPESTE